MPRFPDRHRRAIAVVALVLTQLAGCRQFGDSSRTWWNRLAGSARRRSASPAPEPPVKLTSKQKADVAMAMARSLEHKGQTDPAIEVYSNMIRKDSRRADAHHRLAVLYDKKGECEKSEKHYRATLKGNPNSAEAYCDFGYSCYLQQRWKEAETNLRKSLKLNPESKRAHNDLGLVLARTGRHEEALEEFWRAGCVEAEARANLAFVLMLEERWEEAEKQFELALDADPSSKAASKGLNTVRSLIGGSQHNRPALAAGHAVEETDQVLFVR